MYAYLWMNDYNNLYFLNIIQLISIVRPILLFNLEILNIFIILKETNYIAIEMFVMMLIFYKDSTLFYVN